jgi:spheroidene monooxygenase
MASATSAPTATSSSEPARKAAGAVPRAATPVALLLLVRIADRARWWGWYRFLFARFTLARHGGLRFFKVLGSGHEGGFGLRPSGTHQGLFCVFDDDASAEHFRADSKWWRGYRAHASEHFSVKLRAYSSRGSWSGEPLPVSTEAPRAGPVAVLTRASIRPRSVVTFWRHAPASQRALDGAAGCQLAMGLGEAPLLRQATFSMWDDAACVDAYAREGAHAEAARAAYAQGYFSESMFVRFVPYGAQGVWKGRSFG